MNTLICFILFVVIHEGYGQVQTLTSSTIDESIAHGNWLIKFYAPWCGACAKFEPDWKALTNDFQDSTSIKFGQVNCDEEKAVCNRLRISGYPTLLFVSDSNVWNPALRTKADLAKYLSGEEWKKTFPIDTLDWWKQPVATVWRQLRAIWYHHRLGGLICFLVGYLLTTALFTLRPIPIIYMDKE